MPEDDLESNTKKLNQRTVKVSFITFVSKKIPKSVVMKPPVMKITISAMIKSYKMSENCYDFFLSQKKREEKGNSIPIKIHEYFFFSCPPALSFEET